MDAETQLAKLRGLCPAAELWTDGGRQVAFLPKVEFQAGKSRVTRDLLLWPWERDNYVSRLFLSGEVTGAVARAWTAFNIQGRTWYAVSWKDVPNTLPWLEILANHLRAFR